MGVCKSTNAGATWGLRQNLTSGTGICRDIAVAPTQGAVVYAVGESGSYGCVYRSANAGGAWQDVTGNLNTLIAGYWDALCVAIHPADANKVYVGTTRGVFSTSNGGANWAATGLALSTADLAFSPIQGESIAFAPGTAGDSLFAATGAGVYYSEDSGAAWRPMIEGLTVVNCMSLDVDPVNYYVFAGTNGAGVWRLYLGEPTATANPIWMRYR
jgi:photosystem II stability/assembly factor-like uncharacterized protein